MSTQTHSNERTDILRIALCANHKCYKKQKCVRYLYKQGEYLEFKNICNKKNNHKWFWIVPEIPKPHSSTPVASSPTIENKNIQTNKDINASKENKRKE